MKYNNLQEKLQDFIDQAQAAREAVWAGLSLDADHALDQLILDITNYKANLILEESKEP